MGSAVRRGVSRLVRACWAQAHQVVALAIVVVLFALAGPASAATNVSGTISSNTTWTLAGSPYMMTGSVTVAAGVTLTIEEGVVVQGNNNPLRTMTVNGTLSAVGTASQPVTFTSTTDSAPGQWLGIVFNAGSTGALKYVNARYGGGGAGADTAGMVKVNGGTVTIEDSTFRQSSTSGVAMNGGSSGAGMSLTIRRSKFESNGFYTSSNGDGLNVVNGRAIVEDSAFWSNKEDGVDFAVTSGYSQPPAELSGSSMYKNGSYGVYIDTGAGAETKGPDGNVAGKLGNVVYENVCSIGLAATKVLGCNSNASCIAAAAMTLTPGAGPCRVGRGTVNIVKAWRAQRRANKAFDIAAAGGKHAGFLRRYAAASTRELNSAIRAYERLIAEHRAALKNPKSKIPNWDELDSRQQAALLKREWPSQIARQEEQLSILKRLRSSR